MFGVVLSLLVMAIAREKPNMNINLLNVAPRPEPRDKLHVNNTRFYKGPCVSVGY